MSFWSYDKKAISCMRENANKIEFILLASTLLLTL